MITTSVRAAATRSEKQRPLSRCTIAMGPAAGAMVVMLLGTSALVGCSDSGPARHGERVGDAFATQALRVCASAQRSKDRWSAFPITDFDPSEPKSSDFPEVAAWLEGEVAPTFHDWLGGLTALGTPPTGRQAWAEVLAAVTRIADLNMSQVAAAKAQDADAFAEATHALGDVQPELERAAGEAGVVKCAEVHAD